MCPCLVDIEIVDTRNGAGQTAAAAAGTCRCAAAAGAGRVLACMLRALQLRCEASRVPGANRSLVIAPPPGNESNLVTAGQEACTCDDPTRKVGGWAGGRA